MASIPVKGPAEYHWHDKRALQTFETLGQDISQIWRATARQARGLPPEDIERLRRRARDAASPLVRQACKLRSMYATSQSVA